MKRVFRVYVEAQSNWKLGAASRVFSAALRLSASTTQRVRLIESLVRILLLQLGKKLIDLFFKTLDGSRLNADDLISSSRDRSSLETWGSYMMNFYQNE